MARCAVFKMATHLTATQKCVIVDLYVHCIHISTDNKKQIICITNEEDIFGPSKASEVSFAYVPPVFVHVGDYGSVVDIEGT